MTKSLNINQHCGYLFLPADERERVNQFSYRQLLEDKVFPAMMQTLGIAM